MKKSDFIVSTNLKVKATIILGQFPTKYPFTHYQGIVNGTFI